MNLREIRDQIANRLEGMTEVRRVYTKLGHPPRIIVDLFATATPEDDDTVRSVLAELKCDLPIDIIHSGPENIIAEAKKR